jgi:hypothetical protein
MQKPIESRLDSVPVYHSAVNCDLILLTATFIPKIVDHVLFRCSAHFHGFLEWSISPQPFGNETVFVTLRKTSSWFSQVIEKGSGLFPSFTQIPSVKQSTLETFQVALKLPFRPGKSFFPRGGIL